MTLEQEIIPLIIGNISCSRVILDFSEFRRLSRHELDVALNEAERARKGIAGIAIVSCCNGYWDEVRETTRGKAEWLAKEITDYGG